eukprot:Lithocolla_globosa_v1_NODE_1026_length_2939_cov_14.428225.p1 type:complete len:429 gc:universal NODE_1026_length_2939_cov_14.428225:2088-802(-)
MSVRYSCSCGNDKYPMYRQYFCSHCNQIRCNQCTQTEIILYFCPNCLFAFPSGAVKPGKHRCTRNCFNCPTCSSTLSVVGDQVGEQEGQEEKRHYLVCSYCHWNSLSINLQFEKSVGLASVMMKWEEDRDDVREYEALQSDVEQLLLSNDKPKVQSRLRLGRGGVAATLAGEVKAGQRLARTRSIQDDPNFSDESSVFSDLDKALEERNQDRSRFTSNLPGKTSTRKLVDIEEPADDFLFGPLKSTLPQRFGHPAIQAQLREQLYPTRTRLRTKPSKRCPECEKNLIKPEPKADVSGFKMKLVAIKFLPNFFVIKKQEENQNFVLKIVNPRDDDAKATLSCQEADFPITSFNLNAFNELTEYEDVEEEEHVVTEEGQEKKYRTRANATFLDFQLKNETTTELTLDITLQFTAQEHTLTTSVKVPLALL